MGLYNYASKKDKVAEDTSITSGGVKRVGVADDGAHDLLSDVLIELKKVNFHLSLITEEIKDVEVE